MFLLAISGSFKKDYKRCIKRNYSIVLLAEAIKILECDGELPSKYKPHILSGNLSGFWECHIKPDWLLICKLDF
jgi:mRNA interferase YafQ